MKALACAIIALAAGCGSYTTYKTTRIAPKGHTEWLFGAQVSGAGSLGPEVSGAESVDTSSRSGQKVAPLPELAIAARRGLDERFELQLNGTLLPLKQGQTGSLELAGKMRLYEHDRWSLAAGAGAGYRIADLGGGIVEGIGFSIPVIGGVELGAHQLVVSVTGGAQRWYASGARPVNVPFLGSSLGFLWQLGKSWALLPEVGSAWSPTPNVMTADTKLFHAGIAVLWTR
jgi:hypothetical protein